MLIGEHRKARAAGVGNGEKSGRVDRLVAALGDHRRIGDAIELHRVPRRRIPARRAPSLNEQSAIRAFAALIWIKIPDANGAKFVQGVNAPLSNVGNGWRKRLAQSEEVPVERNFSIKVAAVAVLAASMIQTAVLKADAQAITASWSCQDVGNGSMEPLGQEGRSFGVFDYVCLATSGPANGGLDTGRSVVVFDKSGGTLVTGTGVIRKPDAMAVYLMTDEKMEFVVSDGKVIGITATGHGRYVMAVGSAASLSGKSFTITQKTTAPHQFSIEEKVE